MPRSLLLALAALLPLAHAQSSSREAINAPITYLPGTFKSHARLSSGNQQSLNRYASNSSELGVSPAWCRDLSREMSSPNLFHFPGDPLKDEDDWHLFTSSSQVSTCSVRPATTGDIGVLLDILGDFGLEFGIKGGGRSSDPKASSTTGIQIHMINFNSVTYDPSTQLATIGMGLTWDQVFTKLYYEHGVTVLGGRIHGVGVGGFILGGGYSWLTNQYGLAIDTVHSYKVVTPIEPYRLTIASKTENPDLFFGLKGGFNNFGIVTEVTMNAYSQGQVWGGSIIYAEYQVPSVLVALAAFQTENQKLEADGNANVFAVYAVSNNGTRALTVVLWHNHPTFFPLFQQFIDIPHISMVLDTYDFPVFIDKTSEVFKATGDMRGEFDSASIPVLDVNVLTMIVDTVNRYGVGGPQSFGAGTVVSATMEPFRTAVIDTNRTEDAYPHDRYVSPLCIHFGWDGEENDEVARAALHSAGNEIRSVIDNNYVGASTLPLYSNYAMDDTEMQALFGDNLPPLQAIRQKYDPREAMYLTGGYKF